MRTARNLALDVLRREKVFRDKEPQIAASIEQFAGNGESGAAVHFKNEIKDDRLRMMFACCHPLIPLEAQVALALKTLCGFGTVEIAKAFLTTETTIAKRLTRAKQRVREAGIPYEIPVGEDLANVHGPDAGIAAVQAIRNRKQLDSYYLLYAVLGDFEARRSNFDSAADYFRQSLGLAELKSEPIFLANRIQACNERSRALGNQASLANS